MPGSFPTPSGSTATSRPSAICRSMPAPTCTSRPAFPTTPPSTCPSCRPTPMSACTSTATAPKASCATLRRGGAAAYFRYLPMHYPYVLKAEAETFVVQFGGGISTMVALAAGAPQVTVASNNPAVLAAFRDPVLRDFTGDLLDDPRVQVVPYDGRLYLAETDDRYDVIDLSLADSVGLSNPGGFAIVEKYAYTREAMLSYMRALADGGILSVTLWNKEEPPKSVLKLYATIARGGRGVRPVDRGGCACSSPRATCRPPPSSTSAAASPRRKWRRCAPIPRRCPSTRSIRPASPSRLRRRRRRSSTTTASRSSATAAAVRNGPGAMRRAAMTRNPSPATPAFSCRRSSSRALPGAR